MALLELTLIPIGTETTSVSKYIAGAYNEVRDMEGFRIELTSMGSIIEGDIDIIMDVVRKMQESVFKNGADRVYSVIKVDDRRDKDSNMDKKIESVKEKLE